MPPVTRVRASTLYRLISEAGGPALTAAGFVRADPRKWVRSAKVPVREVIYFAPPGWTTSPRWALSLDYVPHVFARFDYEVRWHAGVEQAEFDLLYDPLDYDWDRRARWEIPACEGRERAMEAARRVVGEALDAAAQFFGPVREISDLPAAFEAKVRRPPVRYGRGAVGSLRPQEQLAYAFTLAKLGRPREGRAWLERFKACELLMPRTTRRKIDSLYESISAAP